MKSLSLCILQDYAFPIPNFFALVRFLTRGWSLFDGAVFSLSRSGPRGSIIAWRIVSSSSSAISGVTKVHTLMPSVSHAQLFTRFQALHDEDVAHEDVAHEAFAAAVG